MWTAALLVLSVFLLVASVDGFYFHFYKYRLYARPDCLKEHWLHTGNAVLFPFTLAPIFLAETAGAWLWLGVAASVVTFAVETWDVFTEKASREGLGGLTPTEYWMHFAMSGMRWAYSALAFAAVPREAWTGAAAWVWRMPAGMDVLSYLPWGVWASAVAVAVLHVLLGLGGRAQRAGERLLLMRPAAA